MEIDDITGHIVDAAVKLHMRLGPGLLESVYEKLLAQDLQRRGLLVERQKIATFDMDGLHFAEGLRLDLLVNGTVAVEVKSVEKLAPIHSKQLLTYLRVLDLRAGLDQLRRHDVEGRPAPCRQQLHSADGHSRGLCSPSSVLGVK